MIKVDYFLLDFASNLSGYCLSTKKKMLKTEDIGRSWIKYAIVIRNIKTHKYRYTSINIKLKAENTMMKNIKSIFYQNYLY